MIVAVTQPLARLGSGGLLALLLASFAACGESDEGEVADAVRGYLAAVADRDGRRACAFLTPEAQLRVFRARRAHAGADHPAEACATVVESFGALHGVGRLRRVGISRIEIQGGRARAHADGVPIKLEKVAGTWKLAVSGVGQDVGDTQPGEQG